MNTVQEVQAIESRLALFVKAEFMPVTARQLNEWIDEAADSGGYVEIPRMIALSGHNECISL